MLVVFVDPKRGRNKPHNHAQSHQVDVHVMTDHKHKDQNGRYDGQTKSDERKDLE